MTRKPSCTFPGRAHAPLCDLVDGVAPVDKCLRWDEDDTPFDITCLDTDGHQVGQDDGGCDNAQ